MNFKAGKMKKTLKIRIFYSMPFRTNLYEPFPAVMKAAPFNLLSRGYNVGKIAVNTHLYISQANIADFPAGPS